MQYLIDSSYTFTCCRAQGDSFADTHVQVMALTEGQCVELDVLASLVAAVRAARERAGTLGMEQRGEGPLRAAVPVWPPHLAVYGAVCASACGVMDQA